MSKHQSGMTRRNLLQFSSGIIGAGIFSQTLGSQLRNPAPVVAQNDITPDAALEKLMQGNERFVKGKRQNPNQDLARLTEVAAGQNPFAAILSCADSRVPSELVFDQGLGDLFVVRVAGNVAAPQEIGSLEFSTLVLGAKVLLVMGHERCGAVDAAIQDAQVPGQIGSILDSIRPAVGRVSENMSDRLTEVCKANVLLQIERLNASPVLSQLVEEGKLKIVGAYYDLDTGSATLVS
jgi:carbonic anhydrase